MQALIDFLTQHPDLALGLVFAAGVLIGPQAVGPSGMHLVAFWLASRMAPALSADWSSPRCQLFQTGLGQS